MTQQIFSALRSQGPNVFYTNDFRIVLENHLQYFRNNSSTVTKRIEPIDAHRWQGDFYGLLAYLNIDNYMHWYIMRLNGIESSDSFNTIINQILLPDPTEIEMIRQQYVTTHPNV